MSEVRPEGGLCCAVVEIWQTDGSWRIVKALKAWWLPARLSLLATHLITRAALFVPGSLHPIVPSQSSPLYCLPVPEPDVKSSTWCVCIHSCPFYFISLEDSSVSCKAALMGPISDWFWMYRHLRPGLPSNRDWWISDSWCVRWLLITTLWWKILECVPKLLEQFISNGWFCRVQVDRLCFGCITLNSIKKPRKFRRFLLPHKKAICDSTSNITTLVIWWTSPVIPSVMFMLIIGGLESWHDVR